MSLNILSRLLLQFQTFVRFNIPFLVALVTGIIAVPITLIGFDFSYYPGDLGDARFNIYLLEHGYQTLLGKHE